jgi:hypothetical protein
MSLCHVTSDDASDDGACVIGAPVSIDTTGWGSGSSRSGEYRGDLDSGRECLAIRRRAIKEMRKAPEEERKQLARGRNW